MNEIVVRKQGTFGNMWYVVYLDGLQSESFKTLFDVTDWLNTNFAPPIKVSWRVGARLQWTSNKQGN